MGKFIVASKSYLDTLVNRRDGETKLGEKVQIIETENWQDGLKNSKARFVVLGIPEDIGVRANFGVGGTHSLYEPALKALLNVQNTAVLNGEDILVLGSFDFNHEMRQADCMDMPEMRELVAYIDESVYPIISAIIAAGKVPIVIGGGHNNSYPLLKGASLVDDKPVNCINLDAHSDFRAMEGRHSGNGFRYAHREGYLEKYSVVGLHENYNAQELIEEFKDDTDLSFSYYEDIFLRDKLTFEEAVENAIGKTVGRPVGLELDLDCIERTLSSASSPCGITTLQARQYVTMCAQAIHSIYLHIAEGAVHLRDDRLDVLTAKLVAYLITDFIKAFKPKRSGWF